MWSGTLLLGRGGWSWEGGVVLGGVLGSWSACSRGGLVFPLVFTALPLFFFFFFGGGRQNCQSSLPVDPCISREMMIDFQEGMVALGGGNNGRAMYIHTCIHGV